MQLPSLISKSLLRKKSFLCAALIAVSVLSLTGCGPKYTLSLGDYAYIPCTYHYYSDNYCGEMPSIGKLTERGAEDQYFCENHYYTYGKVLIGEAENVTTNAKYQASACKYCDSDNPRGVNFLYKGAAMCTKCYLKTIKANDAAK